MPIDPVTGLWSEGVYRTPGGALDSALSMFNVQRSQDMVTRRRSAEDLKALMEVQGLGPEAEAFLATPEGQRALEGLGISSASASALAESHPETKFRKGVQAQPDLDEEGLVNLGVQTGAIKPEKAVTSGVRLGSQKARREKARADFFRQNFVPLVQGGMPLREAAAAVAPIYSRQFPDDPGGFEELISQMPEKATPMTAGKVDLMGAQAGLAGEKAETEAVLREPRKQALVLKAQASKLQAEASKLRAGIEAAKKASGATGGGLSAKDRRAAKKRLSEIEKQRTAIRKDPLTRKYAKEQFDALNEEILEIREQLGDDVEADSVFDPASGKVTKVE